MNDVSPNVRPWARLILLAGVWAAATACNDVGDSSAIPGAGGEDATFDAVDDSADGSEGAASSDDSGEASFDDGFDGQASGDGGLDQLAPEEPSPDSTEVTTAAPDGMIDSTAQQTDSGGQPDVTEGGPNSAVDSSADTAPEMSMDATPEVVADVTTVEDGGDGSPGVPEASAPDAADSAAPLAPCTTQGQTDCVQCFATAAGDGVCTGTEALIVKRDIAKGNLVGGQLSMDITVSCYACLASSLFITSPKQCESLTGNVGSGAQAAETKAEACLNTLSCILGVADGTFASCGNDPPPGDGISNCYCGSAFPTLSGCNGASGTAVNGTCEGVILDGLGDTTATPASMVLGTIITTTFGTGRADAILKAAGTNNSDTPPCPQCYQ
jgi:hypothetical protein